MIVYVYIMSYFVFSLVVGSGMGGARGSGADEPPSARGGSISHGFTGTFDLVRTTPTYLSHHYASHTYPLSATPPALRSSTVLTSVAATSTETHADRLGKGVYLKEQR